MKRIALLTMLAVLTAAALQTKATGQDLYSTGFEATEDPSFMIGPLPQNGWAEVTGPGISSVTDAVKFEADQSLRIAPKAVVAKDLSNSAQSVVYIDSWYRPTLSSDLLNLSALEPSSAIFVFHETDGIVLLDGNGAGGGTWINSGFTALQDFVRITVKLDFLNHKWALYANTNLLGEELGFKNNSINSLAGLQVASSEDDSSYLDDFRVTTVRPEFIPEDTATPTPTFTLTPTATATASSTPTTTSTASETPTFSETPTPTPTQPSVGDPLFWFELAVYWENLIPLEKDYLNGNGDSFLDPYDLLHFLKENRSNEKR